MAPPFLTTALNGLMVSLPYNNLTLQYISLCSNVLDIVSVINFKDIKYLWETLLTCETSQVYHGT